MREIHIPFYAKAILIAIGVWLFVFLAERYFPMGADYTFYFRPLAEQWRDGYWHIYDGVRNRLLYPPWSMFVIAPLGWFPFDTARALLLLVSVLAIIAALRLLYHPRKIPVWILIMALTHLHSFDMYVRGQFDSVVLLGIALAFWAFQRKQPLWFSLALCLATVKPPAGWALVLIVFMIGIRGWSLREKLLASVFPIVCLVISVIAFGIDFPIQFLNNLEQPVDYLSISLWRFANANGIPLFVLFPPLLIAGFCWLRLALREGVTLRVIAIALATNFVFIPYANGDHYVMLLPAFIYVAARHWKLATLIYLLTWTPLLRLVLGYDAAILDIFYPFALLLASWFLVPHTAAAPSVEDKLFGNRGSTADHSGAVGTIG
jgi:hypothetical protein